MTRRLALLPFACLTVAALMTLVLHNRLAAAADAGADAVAAEYAAALDSPDPASPDRAPPTDPGAVLEDARETGGLWVAVLLSLVAAGRTYRARSMPKPGEPEPDPRSWRARSIAIVGGLVVAVAAVADALLGVGGWWSALVAIGTGAAMVWSAFDPVKGSRLAKVAPGGAP